MLSLIFRSAQTSLENSTDGLNTTTRWIIGRRLAAGKSIWIVLTNLRAHVEPGFERTGDGGWRWPDSPVSSFHFLNYDSVGSCGNREYKKKDRSDHLDGDRQFALERVRETQTLKKMRCLLLIGAFRGENKFSCQIPQEGAPGQIHLVVSGFKAQHAWPLHYRSNGTGMVRTSVYALRERRSSPLHYGAVS